MAPTARARRRRTAAGVLPEELVVWEILVRVPAKTLLRWRAVCRSWRRLTSAADFVLAHHRCQPSLPLVTFHGYGRDCAVDAFDLCAAGELRHPVIRFDDYFSSSVLASCDGLHVVSVATNPYYICNPGTRQWAAMPKLKGDCRVAALYHHSSSGEYRILYYKGCLSDAHYYVLTVGSSLDPRYIGRSVASDRPPTLLHNCLHWHLDLGRISGLLVFDTVLESLRGMRPPTTRNSWCYAKVLEMDGMLAISCVRRDYTVVDLWVLQDYETKIWSLKYQLQLPVAELRSIGKSTPFIVSDYGDMLVVVGGDSHLFYCDGKGKLLQQFHWDRVLPRPAWLVVQRKPCPACILTEARLCSCGTATFLSRALVGNIASW